MFSCPCKTVHTLVEVDQSKRADVGDRTGCLRLLFQEIGFPPNPSNPLSFKIPQKVIAGVIAHFRAKFLLKVVWPMKIIDTKNIVGPNPKVGL